MNNSLVTALQAYVEAIFKDVAYAYTKPSELRRDQTRLTHELAIHGHRVVTLDLPAILKHLDKCIDQGLFTSSGLPYSCPKKGYKTPKFLGDLYQQIFDADGKLWDRPSVSAYTVLRQLLGGLKKLKLPCGDERTNDAVRDFIAIETQMRHPTLSWDSDVLNVEENASISFDTDVRSSFADMPEFPLLVDLSASRGLSRKWTTTLQKVCDRVAAQFGDLHLEEKSELPKHGPGVVSNLHRKVSKYTFPCWPRKLQATFPHDYYGTTQLGDPGFHDLEGLPEFSNREFPSRLISVPKTLKSPRLIAAEPVEHQWIQQLIWNQLEARSSRTSIRYSLNFRSQVPNQEWALQGSIDGSNATVDLSSASDRLSCWAVERAFRSNRTLLERIHACRTRWLQNAINPSLGEFIPLKKYACMGSAVTFPLQTIFYACVAVSAVLISDEQKITTRSIERASRQVRVFGDDIILPGHALSVLKDLLGFLGLKVNTDKTYGIGKFRESCGVDAFEGHDVTPAYLTHPPFNVQHSMLGSFVDVSNNFHRRGYWHVANWLMSLFGNKANSLFVVPIDCPYPALQSFVGFRSDHLVSRWNDGLHRRDYKVYFPSQKRKTLDVPIQYRYFQWVIDNPLPDSRWEAGILDTSVSTWRLGWVEGTLFPGNSQRKSQILQRA